MAKAKPLPQAYRVEKVKRVKLAGHASGAFEVVLTPIYYGPDTKGPRVGQMLELVNEDE